MAEQELHEFLERYSARRKLRCCVVENEAIFCVHIATCRPTPAATRVSNEVADLPVPGAISQQALSVHRLLA